MKKSNWLMVLILLGLLSPVFYVKGDIDYTVAEMDFIARKYIMQLNQQPVKLEISPIWHSGSQSLLIPLRFIAEMNRFQVAWNDKTNVASFRKPGKDFTIIMKYPNMQLTSHPNISNYEIVLKNGRFLLDHRCIMKLFGIKAELDEVSGQVVFYTDRDQIQYMAPPFKLFDLNGNTVDLQKTLDNQSTKLVVLNFYSTRCPICAKALPNLQKLHVDYNQKGIVVLGINTDTKNMEAERDEAIRKYGLTYPILLDPVADTYTDYSVSGIPNLFVINKKREIIQHRLGVDNSYFVFLRQFLDKYLAAK